jgi:hypothetical protein
VKPPLQAQLFRENDKLKRSDRGGINYAAAKTG